MNRYHVIDPANWPRRGLFEFYGTFDRPVFSVTVKLPGEELYRHAKTRGESFFLLALYGLLRAANAMPQLRQRYAAGEIREYEAIAAMTPIMTAEAMFRQIWCEYAPHFPAFKNAAAPLVMAARHDRPAPLLDHADDFLCLNCVPFLHFEALDTADLGFDQTVPVITWGKLQQGLIPVNLKCSHRFVDGLHAGRFFSLLEELWTHPEWLYAPAGPAGMP